MIPKEFAEFISSMWFEENGGIIINKYEFNNENIKLEVYLNSGDEEIENQIWEIDILKLKTEKFDIKWDTEIEILEDHFLLWEYIDNQTSIYFNGENKNADNLLADIYRMHKKEFGNKFEIEKYLNDCMSLSDLCNSKSGLFAYGPKKILDKFFVCLEKHNRNPNFVKSNINSKYKNETEIEIEKTLKLLRIGESYFIAENFNFKQKSK
ncbi:MAG: hypothetical protein ABI576_15005 [Flavobacterium sp.]